MAFLYVSLGMGSSHNRPAMCNGLGPVLSSSFNNGSFIFLVFLHPPNGPYIDVHMFTMFYNALKPGANAVVSNIIC